MTATQASIPLTRPQAPRSRGSVRTLIPVEQRTAAHALVAALVDGGVTQFFGVPGGPISPVCQAILDHPKATFIESRHETAAAFAAASYYRACGEVPAVVVTAGPGATNVVTGVANAHLSRTPMIVLCGDVAWASSGMRLLQDSGPQGLDVEAMLGHLCRATERVARRESAASQAFAALEAARGRVPGPALCVVPMDHGRGAVVHRPTIRRSEIHSSERVPAEAVATAADWLMQAERPLVVLGNGCRGAVDAVRRMVDVLNVPFVTTPQAKGIVSEHHPRSLRQGGMAASLWARRYTEPGVDAALVLGTDFDDVSVGPTPYVGEGGRMVHVDLDATVFHRNARADLPVLADVRAFANGVSQHVSREGMRHANTRALLREAKADSPFDTPGAADDDSAPIAPHRAVMDLEAAVDESAAFITDIGEHMLFALHYLTADHAERFHIHLRLGSMGSGIAGAVGLALADRSRPVVCICGDGGMQMNGMELMVAADLGLPIVYAVFNDARYNMVHHGMKQLYGRGGQSWHTRWVDFAAWAGAMGVPSLRIDAPGQISASRLRRLRALGPGPVVLDIRIDRDVRIRGGGRVEALQRMSVHDGGER